MNTIITIPARFDSKRFPGKLCKHLNGKPIIQWVVERSRALRLIKYWFWPINKCINFVKISPSPAFVLMGSNGTDRIAHWVHANLSDDVLIVNIQG